MKKKPDQDDTVDRKALRDLARTGIDGLAIRVVFYVLGAAMAALIVPAVWVAACLGLIAAAELAERRAARALLAAPAPDPEAGGSRPATILAAAHIATALAVALALAAIWVFAGPAEKIVPFCLLAIAVLKVAQSGQPVVKLMILRQAIYMGMVIAMSLRDLALMDTVTLPALGTGLLPLLVLAVVVISVSLNSARTYRDHLRREHEMADARDEAKRADAGKSAFIATISHELRTPLNGILGMAQTLLGSGLSSGQQRLAEVIAESGRTLNTLLNDILDYTKLEAGKLKIVPAEEDLRLTAEHVSRLYGPLAREKGLDFEIAVESGVPARLMFDPVRVRQCLSNLISNAIKFTETGSVQVTISAAKRQAGRGEAPGQMVTVIVADTGVGISAGQRKELFQPYSQAHGSLSRRFGGSGLGLSITRQLAESMGGAVTLENGPGKGSVFRFSFRAGAVSPPVDGGSVADAAADLSGHRVLVADDIETNRAVLRMFLQPLGIHVVEVADGDSVLAALAETRFDAVFLDLNMPDLGGEELVVRIRRGEGGRPDIPLLAFTADSAADGVDLSAEGFDGIVTKPVDPRQLQSTLLGAILRRSRYPKPDPSLD